MSLTRTFFQTVAITNSSCEIDTIIHQGYGFVELKLCSQDLAKLLTMSILQEKINHFAGSGKIENFIEFRNFGFYFIFVFQTLLNFATLAFF